MGCCQKRKNEKILDQLISSDQVSSTKNTKSNKTINTTNNETQNDFDFQNAIFKLSYSDFEPLKLLGRGSFGEVLLVKLKANKKLYAMKVLD